MLNSNDGGGGRNRWNEEQKKEKSISKRGTFRKIILQYSLDGVFIAEWVSLTLVSKTLNLDYNRLIKCCKMQPDARSVGGFLWRYKGGEIVKIIEKYIDPSREQMKSILQYSLDGEFIQEWSCVGDAAKHLKISSSTVRRLVAQHYPKYNKRDTVIEFQWRYKIGDFIPQNISAISGIHKIAQYDLIGNLVKTWQSTKEIVDELKLEKKYITSCIRGEHKKYSNSQWRSFTGNVPEKIKSVYKNPHHDESTMKLLQYGMDGKFIKGWDDVSIASKELSINTGSIHRNIRGELKSAGKFRWQYGEIKNVVNLMPLRIVCQYTMDGILIREWSSQVEIFKVLNYPPCNISACINGRLKQANGFVWKYK